MVHRFLGASVKPDAQSCVVDPLNLNSLVNVVQHQADFRSCSYHLVAIVRTCGQITMYQPALGGTATSSCTSGGVIVSDDDAVHGTCHAMLANTTIAVKIISNPVKLTCARIPN